MSWIRTAAEERHCICMIYVRSGKPAAKSTPVQERGSRVKLYIYYSIIVYGIARDVCVYF